MLTGKALDNAITLCAGFCFLLFGYDQGVMSGLLTGSSFTTRFPEIDTVKNPGSSSLQGTVVAIYEIGCFFGAIFAFCTGEVLGRRRSIMIGCSVLTVGAVIQCSAYGIPQLIVGRIVAGLGNGINTSAIPVWHAELMKAHKRGKGLAIEFVLNIAGVATAYWVDYGFSFVENESQFRAPIAFQILFALVTLGMIVFLPESPRWLLNHGHEEEALRVLEALQPKANPEIIRAEVDIIQHALYEEKEIAGGTSFKALFKNGPQKFRYRVLLGIGGQFIQQLSGVNLITYYAAVIFETSIGMSKNTALLLAGFNGIAYFLSTFPVVWLLDRIGRRPLMLFAVFGQAACMAVLAGTVADGSKAAGIVAAVMLFAFNFFFAVGLLAIPWLLPAEYAPLAIRTKAASLATASNWIFTFLVVEVVPVSIASIQWRTYLYFAIFNLAFAPVIYFFYPETKNLSLEQIDLLFTGERVLMHLPPGVAVGLEAAAAAAAAAPASLGASEKEKGEGVAVVEDVRAAGMDKL
ncbi:general substrate transporter [Phyllosticta citribraziliensis]|uniref:General substrate transporter n=1 Tax=Phyllosticta citribraziliensis TaxID=989973 RepID=A0ABR1LKW2_9PEZI